MEWWGWLLLGWAALAISASVLLGAVAAKQRASERATRARLYKSRGDHPPDRQTKVG